MDSKAVVLNLVIRYPLRPAQEAAYLDYETRERLARVEAERAGVPYVPILTYEQIMADVSERFLAEAMHHVYGDNVPREARKMWAGVQRQLMAAGRELALDVTTFRWLHGVCTNDKVKVAPRDVMAHEMFLERLDEVKAALDAAPAEAKG